MSFTVKVIVISFCLLHISKSITWYRNFGKTIDSIVCPAESQSIVEYYTINGFEYMFLSERVPWDEADVICKIYDGHLAILGSLRLANKLAYAIANSNIEMQNMWIGGQRLENGNWIWADQSDIPKTSVNGFPPWTRKPIRPWKECLAIERRDHDTALFVDLDCRLAKPFMCQRDLNGPINPIVSLPTQWITVDKSTFVLYHGRISWAEAAAFCRMRAHRLAIIKNNHQVKVISKAMFRSRPSFENVWIGGHFVHENWHWLSTGEKFAAQPDENNYPPWHHNSTNQHSGCVLLDRHLCQNPVFVVMDCDRQREFLCEKTSKRDQIDFENKTIKIEHNGVIMQLFLNKLNWLEAKIFCRNNSGYLTEIYDKEQMNAIIMEMSDHSSEPTHVWLGGRLVNGTWKWVHSGKQISGENENNNIIPWCYYDKDPKNACLNMDREAREKPNVYGLKCKIKQPFVCTIAEKKVNDVTDPLQECENKQKDIAISNKFYQIWFEVANYDKAVQICKKSEGTIADITNSTLNVLSKASNEMEFCQVSHYWIKANENCRSVNLISKTFQSVSTCDQEKGFICEFSCNIPENGVYKNNIWKCEIKNDQRICSVINCKNNLILMGPKTVKCLNNGKVKSTYPKCSEHLNVIKELKTYLEENLKNSGMLFVLDESTSAKNKKHWKKQIQFVESVIKTFPISPIRPFGLILYSAFLRIPIPYIANDSCQVLEIMQRLTPYMSTDYTRYYKVLNVIQQQIQQYQPDRKTLIFFLTINGKHQYDEDYGNILKALSEKHIMYGIGIGSNIFVDESVVNDNIKLYTFPNLKKFEDTVLFEPVFSLNCFKQATTAISITTVVKETKSKELHICSTEPITVTLKNETFCAFFDMYSYKESEEKCRDYGGHLAHIRKTDVQFLVKAIMTQMLYCVNELELWISVNAVPCAALAMSVLSTGNEEIKSCDALHGRICKIDCSWYSEDQKYSYTNISCTMYPDGKLCEATCVNRTVMIGADEVICNNSRWTTLQKHSTYLPICYDEDDTAVHLLHTISYINETCEGILFLVDESQNKKWWLLFLKFMISIISSINTSDKFLFGFISFKEKARIQVPYHSADICESLNDIIDRDDDHSSNSSTLYLPVLKAAEKQITKQENKKTAIVLISEYSDEIEDLNEIINRLKKKHIIITVGVGKQRMKTIYNISSMHMNNLLMYKYNTHKSLERVAHKLQAIGMDSLNCKSFT